MEKLSIGTLITMIERDFNYCLYKHLRQFKLGKHDVRVLREIYANQGLSQQNIGTILKEDKITITKSVKQLVEQDYIKKVQDQEDKRITRLYVTENGLKIREQLLQRFSTMNEAFTDGLSSDELEKVLDLLARLSENIHKEAIRLRTGAE